MHEQVRQEDVDVGYIETKIGVSSVGVRGGSDDAVSKARVKLPRTSKLLLGKSECFPTWHALVLSSVVVRKNRAQLRIFSELNDIG